MLIILFCIYVIIVFGEVWWGVLGLLICIPVYMYRYTNIFRSFRSNNCPLSPLVINEQGVSYVDEDNENIFIKWGKMIGISYRTLDGKYIRIDYIGTYTNKHRGNYVEIDVTYANYGLKEIVKIMNSYLQSMISKNEENEVI